MKVLFVASECAPFAKTGGLGDVLGALPDALHRRGLDVKVVLPLYQGIDWDLQERLEGELEVPMGGWTERGAVRLGRLENSEVPIYLLEHINYFDRPQIYGERGEAYGDNLERFTFLSRGALRLCLALGWHPDVVNANDWQTALVPVYLNTVERPTLGHAASLFTIHNLAHQGVFGIEDFSLTGLDHFDPHDFEHDGALNLVKGALRHATLLSTVSPTYAAEIQTPEHGYGLDYVLRERSGDLHGLLNGIDTTAWNPADDDFLAASYDAEDLSGKAICKAALQEKMGLPVRSDLPLFGLIARLTPQKGVDILAAALDRILDLEIQLVLLGSGEDGLEALFQRVARERGDRFRCHVGFDNPLAHQIEAGADFFLMPSRFEPCGLNQLYSLRYGTLPVVRATGGLADTVWSYEEPTGDGTGFVFHDLTPQAILDAIGWATATWYQRPEHIDLMRRRAMSQDFSWDRSAHAYELLYRMAIERRR